MASIIDTSPRLTCRTAEYLVETHASTERKAVTMRNQVITLTSGPWSSDVSHRGASVVVRLEMVLMMSRTVASWASDDEGLFPKAVAGLFPTPRLASSQSPCLPAPPEEKFNILGGSRAMDESTLRKGLDVFEAPPAVVIAILSLSL